MNVQVVNDAKGNPQSVMIPYHEWRNYELQYKKLRDKLEGLKELEEKQKKQEEIRANMLAVKHKVIKDFKLCMKDHYGERLDKIVLYGSYARGDFHEESDIDFMIVLKDEEIQPYHEIYDIHKKVNQLTLKHDLIISYVPTALKKFQNARTPLLYNVRKEGITV